MSSVVIKLNQKKTENEGERKNKWTKAYACMYVCI